MGEINYILDEMKNMPDDDTPFTDADMDLGLEKLGGPSTDLNKMPTTLDELKEILSNFNFLLQPIMLKLKLDVCFSSSYSQIYRGAVGQF
jgi:hypothetical protein